MVKFAIVKLSYASKDSYLSLGVTNGQCGNVVIFAIVRLGYASNDSYSSLKVTNGQRRNVVRFARWKTV